MNHFGYENWTRNKAVVHTGPCGSCNEGRGIHSTDSGRNGKWHGPFLARETVMTFARTLLRPDTRFCGKCGG
jgi:hypothetical protein